MSDERWQAGPALDAEISRRVFQQPAEVYPGGAFLLNDAGRVPAYSRDVAAAMQVFEALVEMTGCGEIHADMEDARGEGFIVSVSCGFDPESICSMGPLPLAICRTALAYISASQGEGER